MKKKANFVAMVGFLLIVIAMVALYGLGRNYVGDRWLRWETAVFVGVSLILGAFLFNLMSARESRRQLASDGRIFFWLAGLAMIGTVMYLTVFEAKARSDQEIIEKFHALYFRRAIFNSHFLGILSVQYPVDNWVMQEIISETKPDIIVESGTARGGTALFYATILEKVNERGKIITIDIDGFDPKVLDFKIWRDRVEAIRGSSVAPEVFDRIKKLTQDRTVMVTLDSDHSKRHVLKELELYSQLVSPGSYLVVQDTHLNGHPIPYPALAKSGGPWEAVEEFLKKDNRFEIDRNREKHLITQNPSGYRKRIR